MPRATFLLAAACLLASVAFSGAAAADGRQARPNGLPSDPAIFPIGVWLQSPRFAPEYQAIGVNLFVGLNKGPTEDELAELARDGMPAFAEQNDVGLGSPNANMIRGWLLKEDEPDNAQALPSGGWGQCVPAKAVVAETRAIKAKDPTRPVLVSFGRGAADPSWMGRGNCTGDLAYYGEAAVGADILAFDIYPVSSGYGDELDYPARGVMRLKAAAQAGQHVWVIIETTRGGWRNARVTPAELRSEILLAVTAGADGVIYFAHEWTGGFREDGLFRYPEIVRAVRDTNALLMRLAPAINSPTIEGRVAASGTIPFMTMLKEQGGALYLFAGSTDPKPGSAAFAVQGAGDGRAEVVGEDRQVPISNGVLRDDFKGYEVHIYRISRGG